jgi:hypothetical protein
MQAKGLSEKSKSRPWVTGSDLEPAFDGEKLELLTIPNPLQKRPYSLGGQRSNSLEKIFRG